MNAMMQTLDERSEAARDAAAHAEAAFARAPAEADARADAGDAEAAEAGAAGDAADATGAQQKKWYVIQAHANYERRVQEALQEYIIQHEMQEFFGKILVPTEQVVEMKGGQKRTSERKFFPGYVLVHMHLTDATWHMVKSIPRVSGFVGGIGNRPMPITDAEANDIIAQVDNAGQPKMKYTYAPGELVRIVDGPFSGFDGEVKEVNFEKMKLRVLVNILGRSTPVDDLDFSHVVKS